MPDEKELNAPKIPDGVYPELSPNPNDEGVVLEKGQFGTAYDEVNTPKVLPSESHFDESEWERDMKEVLVRDHANNEVQCGIHFYCDGDLETGADVVVGRDLCIDGLNNIQDKDGNPLIPAPENSDLGKFLKVATTGIMWSNVNTPTEVEIVKKSVFEAEGYVYRINTLYAVWNDTAGDHYGEVYMRYYEQ